MKAEEFRFKKGNKKFTILSPPPNVTGRLHIGHALTYSIQSCLARIFANFKNCDSFLLPGFDHGGISTETSATKAMGLQSIENKEEKFKKIELFANEARKNIEEQMKLLNIFADDSFSLYTFDQHHKEIVEQAFIELYNMGYIKRDRKIVNCDPSLKTSISDLEVDYQDIKSNIYFVNYQTSIGKEITIATTRPETIFADAAIAFNPTDERYQEFKGQSAFIPIINRQIPFIEAEYVSKEFGTGLLKITPAHSLEDAKLGKKFSLQQINMINEEGKIYLDEISEKHLILDFQGLSTDQAKSLIEKKLELSKNEIMQKIPISSKTGTKIEHILMEQWFFDVSKGAKAANEIIDKKTSYKAIFRTKFTGDNGNQITIKHSEKIEEMFGVVAIAHAPGVGNAFQGNILNFGIEDFKLNYVPIIEDSLISPEEGFVAIIPALYNRSKEIAKKHSLPTIEIYDKNGKICFKDFKETIKNTSFYKKYKRNYEELFEKAETLSSNEEIRFLIHDLINSTRKIIQFEERKEIILRDNQIVLGKEEKCFYSSAKLEFFSKKIEKDFMSQQNYFEFIEKLPSKIEVIYENLSDIFSTVAFAVNPKDKRYNKLLGKEFSLTEFSPKIRIVPDKSVNMFDKNGIMPITINQEIKSEILSELKMENKKYDLFETGKLIFPLELYEKFERKDNFEIFLAEISDFYGKSKEELEDVVVSSTNKIEIEEIDKFDIYPENWKEIYKNWLEKIDPMWCISRNITWGHRIPAWYKINNTPEKNNIVETKNLSCKNIVCENCFKALINKNSHSESLKEFFVKNNNLIEEEVRKECKICKHKIHLTNKDDFYFYFSIPEVICTFCIENNNKSEKLKESFENLTTIEETNCFVCKSDICTEKSPSYCNCLENKEKNSQRVLSEMREDVLLEKNEGNEQKNLEANNTKNICCNCFINILKKQSYSPNFLVICNCNEKRKRLFTNLIDQSYSEENKKNNLIEYKIQREKPGKEWIQSEEVLDTWFSSALWPLSYKYKFGMYPTDVLVTAYDIIFFWVARMVMVSLILDNSIPFKYVYIHRLVRDEEGQKMSKTKGNVIDPIKLLEEGYSSDELALSLISTISPEGSIRFSKEKVDEAKKFVTKVNNLHKYITNFVKPNCSSSPTEYDEETLAIILYFIDFSKKIDLEIEKRIKTIDLHIIRDETIKFTYFVCDWLVEFHKINKNLSNLLLEIYRKILLLLNPFIPKTTETLWKEIFETNLLEFEYKKSPECFEKLFEDPNFDFNEQKEKIELSDNLISTIKSIRSLKMIGVSIHLTDVRFAKIITKLCNIKEENKSTNYIVNSFEFHVSGVEKKILEKKIFELEQNLERIEKFFTNDLKKISPELIQEKVTQKKLIEFEIQQLKQLLLY